MSAKALLSASVSAPPAVYVEDVFSTFLYTGTGSTQTITNGIDLAGEGGLVWTKNRGDSSAGLGHFFWDTVRGNDGVGNSRFLRSNSSDAESTDGGFITSTSSTGYTVGNTNRTNGSGDSFASWTFRKAAKFFDVVTYTGDGTSNRQIAHNLGSTPGCIIVKRTNSTANWAVYHRGFNSGATTGGANLNTTGPFGTETTFSNNNSAFTSTYFLVTNTIARETNGSGDTYVAYVFAHDAGGFGDAGTDSVVSCGSFTTDGSGIATINLGWEPQWLLWKDTNVGGQNWTIFDTMRGWTVATSQNGQGLFPNLSDAETAKSQIRPTSTGFYCYNLEANKNYIYIAIRRGPMKTPTVGTEVFAPLAVNNLQNAVNTVGFPIDSQWYGNRNGGSSVVTIVDRLRGVSTNSTQQANYLVTSSTNAEVTTPGNLTSNFWTNTSFRTTSLADGANATWYNFRRAPGFFDVVAYVGEQSYTPVPHNLTAIPELVIQKKRTGATALSWYVTGFQSGKYLLLNAADAAENISSTFTTHTATTFKPFIGGDNNIAYLFATAPGVSKVGNYTGTGTTKQIDCGFTAGARLVLIKRTDSTGDWYVWDTARGIISGNDPYLWLNTTDAEVTNTDYIDPLSSGFEISSTAPAAINANGGSFIFLAIS